MIPTTDAGRRADLGTESGVRHAWLTYGPELRAFAARRLGSRVLAEDIVQETLLRAWRSADAFDPARGTMRGWLYTILRNLLVDFARSQACRPRTSPIVDDLPTTDGVEDLVGWLALADAINRLTVEHRQVIYYCHVKQRPHAEIADLLGVPVGTVRSRLFYAREALKHELTDIGAARIDTPRRPEAA